MMHIGICDDDKAVLRELRSMLEEKYPRQFILHTFTRGSELLHALAEQQETMDVILLDIRMPRLNGINTAKRIRDFDPDVVIIFLTQWDEYLHQGYDVQAYHYLMKPIDRELFFRVFDRALARAQRRRVKESLLIENKYETVRLPLEDIIFIESCAGKLVVHAVSSRKYQYYGVLKQVAAHLEPLGFFQAHKSYLINIQHVQHIDQKLSVAILSDNHRVLIAKAKVRKLLLTMRSFFSGWDYATH